MHTYLRELFDVVMLEVLVAVVDKIRRMLTFQHQGGFGLGLDL